ncbi:hypothetical protein ACX31A_11630 [Dermacoccus nishinomiyaensis]
MSSTTPEPSPPLEPELTSIETTLGLTFAAVADQLIAPASAKSAGSALMTVELPPPETAPVSSRWTTAYVPADAKAAARSEAAPICARPRPPRPERPPPAGCEPTPYAAPGCSYPG